MTTEHHHDERHAKGQSQGVDLDRAEGRGVDKLRRGALLALGAAALGAVASLASPARAQGSPAQGSSPSPTGTPSGMTVAAVSLSVSGNSKLNGLTLKPAGAPAEIKLTVKSVGSGTKSVPWRIEVDGKPLKSGTIAQMRGDSTVTVTATWTSTAGVHNFAGIVDPDNTLQEPAAQRPDNRRVTTAEFDEWVTWGDQIFDAVVSAVHQWQKEARFANIMISGSVAQGPLGCLGGPDLEQLIKRANQVSAATGTFRTVRDGFAKAVGAKWKAWQSNVTVPGLVWYPTFLLVYAAEAPPTANTPMTLAACKSAKVSEMLTAAPLASAALGELKAVATSANAKRVIEAFASTLSTRFAAWIVAVRVEKVMGTGPVPAYKPPWVTVGPVVGGRSLPGQGHLNNRAF